MTEAEREQQHVDDRALRVQSDRRAQAKVNARARVALVLLGGFLTLVVLAALALIVWQGSIIRDNQDRIAALVEAQAAQARDVKAVLAATTENDRRRAAAVREIVASVAEDQRRALVAHDRRTEALLRRNETLLEREVFAPSNQERQVAPVPPLRLPASVVGPPTGAAPAPAPAPAPQPAPAPAPCRQSGKSGKCKK